MFTELVVGSKSAGRVFLASMLSSIGAVASNMGDLFISTGIGMLALSILNPWAAIAAGIALKMVAGTMRGLASKQTAAPVLATGFGGRERLEPEANEAMGSMTFIVNGDFVGSREWIAKLAEQLRIAQRDNNVEVVYSG
jgi:hypothetical protein